MALNRGQIGRGGSRGKSRKFTKNQTARWMRRIWKQKGVTVSRPTKGWDD